MSIIDTFLGLFANRVEDEPIINKSLNFGVTIFNNNPQLNTFYKFYQNNQYVRSNVINLMDTIGKDGFELVDSNGNPVDNKTEAEVKSLFTDSQGKDTFSEFKKRSVRDYQVGGNLYVFRVRNEDETETVGLQILDPRFMSPITDSFGFVLGYVQNINGKKTFMLPDEIWHLKYDTGLDDETVGLPLLKSLMIDISLDEEAKASNLSFFLNNQTPASLIVVDDEISADDAKDLKETLKATFKGGKNKHKGGIISGIKEVIKLQDKITEAEFTEMRKMTLENTCALFGVPKTILGYTEGVNYSNAQTQFLEYIENTIRPNQDTFNRFYTQILKDIGFEDTNFRFLDQHVDIVAQKSKTVLELVNNGLITINEGREQLGLSDSKQKDSDQLWIGTNKKVVGSKVENKKVANGEK